MCSLFLVSSMIESRSALKIVTKETYRVQQLTMWEVPVEEHVLLVLATDFALGGEDLAHEFAQALLEQVALGAQYAVLACQCITLRIRLLQCLLQGGEFFDGGWQIHCSF